MVHAYVYLLGLEQASSACITRSDCLKSATLQDALKDVSTKLYKRRCDHCRTQLPRAYMRPWQFSWF